MSRDVRVPGERTIPTHTSCKPDKRRDVMEYEIGHVTHQGNRPSNQDRFLIAESEDAVLLVVADGMGGHPRGDQAAQYAVDTCNVLFRRATKPVDNPHEFLREMFAEAHRQVVQFGRRQRPPIRPRTTCTAALIQSGTAWAVHVGDSRLYVLRSGRTVFRTSDHSYVEGLYKAGKISRADRKIHPRRNYVTRCLGGEESNSRASLSEPVSLEKGDVVLVCSDGLWNGIDEQTLNSTIDGKHPLSAAVETLAEHAVSKKSPCSDNVSAVALRLSTDSHRGHRSQPHSGAKEEKDSTRLAPSLDGAASLIDMSLS
jgi:serine/threonine protein phosphatase PrpC